MGPGLMAAPEWSWSVLPASGDPIGPARPMLTANMAALVRLPTPSLRNTAARWAFTVFSDRNSAREISRLLNPWEWDSGRNERSNRFRTALGDRTFPDPVMATRMAWLRSSGVESLSRYP